jgi:hypothetical protein
MGACVNLGLRKQASKRLVGFHGVEEMNTTMVRCRAARCYGIYRV